jgi:hypothetical protein
MEAALQRPWVRPLSRILLIAVAVVAVAWAVHAAQSSGALAQPGVAPLWSPIDPDNDPPIIAHLDGDSQVYTDNSGPQLLDQNTATLVTDPDSPSFGDGALTVSIISGSTPAQDVLGLETGTDLALSAGTDVGSVVTVLGTAVGSVTSNGRNGDDLTVGFNVFASQTAATLLLRAVTYENTALVPATDPRTVRFTVSDGWTGGLSAPADVTVSVVISDTLQRTYLPLVMNGN